MSEKRFDYNNTDGTAIAPGNAAALTGASQQTNGTWVFNAALARFEGSTGLRATVGTVTTTISRFAPNATNLVMSCGFAFRIDQVPTQTFHTYASLRNSSGPALRLIWDRLNRVGIRGTGTSAAEVFTDNSLTIGKMYYVTIRANASTNTVTVKFYDATTRELAATVSSTGAISIGTTAFNGIDLGWANSDPGANHTANFDSLVLDDGRTTEIMPASWQALAGQMWDGSALQNGSLQLWDGTALQALSAVSVN